MPQKELGQEFIGCLAKRFLSVRVALGEILFGCIPAYIAGAALLFRGRCVGNWRGTRSIRRWLLRIAEKYTEAEVEKCVFRSAQLSRIKSSQGRPVLPKFQEAELF